MKYWNEELALVESAALALEQREAEAESRFDSVHAAAEARGEPAAARQSPELQQWLAARAETDAAWGRWAHLMDNRPQAAQG